MTVYVDDWFQKARVGRHTSRWCHLFSDASDEELHTFAARIGLKREYFQRAGDPVQMARHYDVTEGKRAEAVRAGAVEIAWREAGRLRAAERDRLRAERDRTRQTDAGGVDMKALATTLGHSPYASTVDTYASDEHVVRRLVELCPGGCGRPTNDPNDDLCSSCLEDGDHLA